MEQAAIETMMVNWWLAKKPDSWSMEEYRAHPGFNCKTVEEEDLAFVVSRWLLDKETEARIERIKAGMAPPDSGNRRKYRD